MNTKFETMFMERSPQYAFLISRLQCALDKKHVEFSDINTENMRKFKNYMDDEVAANTLKTYFAIFSAFLRECYNDGLIQNVKCLSALKVKKTPQQNVALDEEEVQRIYDYYERTYNRIGHYAEKDVLTLFLIECYCGARGSDVECFTRSNIQDGMLSYVSKKTKTLAVIPVHKNLPKLIDRIPNKQYERSVKNSIIKRVAKKVGITEPVTLFYRGRQRSLPKCELLGMHSARRSCITNLLNRNVPLVQVSKLAGHSTPTMTQRYYCSDKIQLDEKAMEFFKG